jgi:hypothetical protein
MWIIGKCKCTGLLSTDGFAMALLGERDVSRFANLE